MSNVEFGYEQGLAGPEDKTYRVAQTPEDFVGRAWEVAMAGGYTAYYYTYTAWDVLRPKDTTQGCTYFKQLRDFFESPVTGNCHRSRTLWKRVGPWLIPERNMSST